MQPGKALVLERNRSDAHSLIVLMKSLAGSQKDVYPEQWREETGTSSWRGLYGLKNGEGNQELSLKFFASNCPGIT